MVPHIRVLLYAATPTGAPTAVTDAYHQISQRLSGTPGLLNSELLQEVTGSGEFIIMSEWSSLDAFQMWEAGSDHRHSTAPLRPYHSYPQGAAFGIYKVAAGYRETAT
jgi:heme oxygenase (mycobilin-producing)